MRKPWLRKVKSWSWQVAEAGSQRQSLELEVKVKIARSCPTLTSWTIAHGILQARILEWVAFPSSKGIFPTQGLNSGLPHCRQILYQLSHKGSPLRAGHYTNFLWAACFPNVHASWFPDSYVVFLSWLQDLTTHCLYTLVPQHKMSRKPWESK